MAMQPQESAAGFVSDHTYISAGNGVHTILSVSCILCSFLEEIRLLEVTCSMEVLELDKQVRFIYECFIARYNASHVIGLAIYLYNRHIQYNTEPNNCSNCCAFISAIFPSVCFWRRL